MSRYADTAVDVPDPDLAVQGPAEQILTVVVPVYARDPGVACAAGREVTHMLSVLHVVKGDDACVSGGGEAFAAGREGDCSNGLRKACQDGEFRVSRIFSAGWVVAYQKASTPVSRYRC